ncbi:MAG: hypothetical protein FWD73_09135 [Polyangiaceae bacterium]|nr:hypothetical protein [Polyangiaceae bacterium]
MRRSRILVLIALPLAAVACGSGHGQAGEPVHHPEHPALATAEVTDDAFAGSVRDLLTSKPNERAGRLAGVVSHQMTRAAARFKERDRDRAIASLSGAMFLVRAGELTGNMLGANGYAALRAASEEFARRGDEGRARATYELLSRLAPAHENADIRDHLNAIIAWTRQTSGNGAMQIAGALEAAAVTRHLLEPSLAARDDAAAKATDFVKKAMALRTSGGAQITNQDRIEAVRALVMGTTVLAAIYLRNADPRGALNAINTANLRELTRPELIESLQAVIDNPDSDKWLDLARIVRSLPQQTKGDDIDDVDRDVDLLRVASFVAAVEAYRLDPTSLEPAAYVASMLVEMGMGEAAPAVLADAIQAHADPHILGLGLAITMQAMGRGVQADDPASVRRIFLAARPILAAADTAKNVQPSPAKVYAMMGEIEIREGRLPDARKLLTLAEQREKSGGVMLSLARLDWHDGQAEAARQRLRAALSAANANSANADAALRGEILLLQSDIAREQGDASAARKPLAAALKDLAAARSATRGDDRARVERLIARVLDRFGAGSSALKALERALEAAPRDKQQAAATLGHIVGRAFVKGDLTGARDGLARAVSAEIERDDIVYYALWVRLLERQMRVPTDGSADRVLAQAASDPHWVGKVAAYGAGKLSVSGLVAAAQTPTQKTESLFYSAIEQKISGNMQGADAALKQVLVSPGLDLMEVALAREILSGSRAQVGGPVPEVGLP